MQNLKQRYKSLISRPVLIKVLLSFVTISGLLAAYWLYSLYQARSANPIDYWQLTEQAYASDNLNTIDHSSWQAILTDYASYSQALNATVFDYAKLAADDNQHARQQLKNYLQALQQIDPRAFNHREQFAYWVNIYNALTIDLVLSNYPVESIREIHQLPIDGLGEIIGPWDIKVANIAGKKLSLNQIEHGILRSIWREPRVHYVINCASRGCPNLALQVISAERLEQQLTTAAQDFINHPRAVDLQGNKLTLSSIYNWFAEDFGEDQNTRLNHLSQYAKPALQQALMKFNGDIDYQYNWQLNQPLNE